MAEVEAVSVIGLAGQESPTKLAVESSRRRLQDMCDMIGVPPEVSDDGKHMKDHTILEAGANEGRGGLGEYRDGMVIGVRRDSKLILELDKEILRETAEWIFRLIIVSLIHSIP